MSQAEQSVKKTWPDAFLYFNGNDADPIYQVMRPHKFILSRGQISHALAGASDTAEGAWQEAEYTASKLSPPALEGGESNGN